MFRPTYATLLGVVRGVIQRTLIVIAWLVPMNYSMISSSGAQICHIKIRQCKVLKQITKGTKNEKSPEAFASEPFNFDLCDYFV